MSPERIARLRRITDEEIVGLFNQDRRFVGSRAEAEQVDELEAEVLGLLREAADELDRLGGA